MVLTEYGSLSNFLSIASELVHLVPMWSYAYSAQRAHQSINQTSKGLVETLILSKVRFSAKVFKTVYGRSMPIASDSEVLAFRQPLAKLFGPDMNYITRVWRPHWGPAAVGPRTWLVCSKS